MIKSSNQIVMEDLKRVLNEEILVYETMERHLADKKEVIVRGDLEALVQIDDELAKLTERGHELEKERLGALVKMGRQNDTLKDFIQSLETGEDSRMLSQARTRLVDVTTGIRQLSKTNRDLLTQSIRLIEQSVDVIASLLAPQGASYVHPQGQRIGQNDPASEANSASTIIREA